MALQTPPPSAPPSPELTDFAPPIERLPWPPWLIALAVGAALLVLLALGLLLWLGWRRLQRKAPALPSPRATALRELEALRAEVDRRDAYDFSVRVSDVLRHFIGAQYGLRAEQQTSPEFLASLAGTGHFGEEDRQLLGRFLEKCDLIKFARIAAGREDSLALLASAVAFVQGGRA